jgi:hypothetical protein
MRSMKKTEFNIYLVLIPRIIMEYSSDITHNTTYSVEVVQMGNKYFAGVIVVCPNTKEIICIKYNGVKFEPYYDSGPFSYYYAIFETDSLKKTLTFDVYTTMYMHETVTCESTSMSSRMLTTQTLFDYCEIILREACDNVVNVIKYRSNENVEEMLLVAIRRITRALEYACIRCGNDVENEPQFKSILDDATDITSKLEANITLDALQKYLTELSEGLKYVYDGPAIYEYSGAYSGAYSGSYSGTYNHWNSRERFARLDDIEEDGPHWDKQWDSPLGEERRFHYGYSHRYDNYYEA